MNMKPATKKWVCSVCKYKHEGDEPPKFCPTCYTSKNKFNPCVEGVEAPPAADTK
jgi:rubrerythrin